jgi:hypothetical protein
VSVELFISSLIPAARNDIQTRSFCFENVRRFHPFSKFPGKTGSIPQKRIIPAAAGREDTERYCEPRNTGTAPDAAGRGNMQRYC